MSNIRRLADCTSPEAFVMASVPDAMPLRLGLLFERRLRRRSSNAEEGPREAARKKSVIYNGSSGAPAAAAQTRARRGEASRKRCVDERLGRTRVAWRQQRCERLIDSSSAPCARRIRCYSACRRCFCRRSQESNHVLSTHTTTHRNQALDLRGQLGDRRHERPPVLRRCLSSPTATFLQHCAEVRSRKERTNDC